MADISTNPQNTIIRRKQTNNFTIIPNAPFTDERLPFDARGMLVFMLTHPDDWEWHTAYLIKSSPAGKDKIYRLLKLLSDHGYVRKLAIRNEMGKIVKHTYIVSDHPLTDNQEMANPQLEKAKVDEVPNGREVAPQPENPQEGLPLTAYPDTDLPEAENPPRLNTKDNKIINNTNTRVRARDDQSENKKNMEKINEGFDKFWSEYRSCRKGNRVEARRVFTRLILGKHTKSRDYKQEYGYSPTIGEIVSGAREYSDRMERDDKFEYTKGAAAWLNGLYWKDESEIALPPEVIELKKTVENWPDDKWRVVLSKLNGHWPDKMGGRPGEPHCIIPEHMIEEFDLTTRFGVH